MKPYADSNFFTKLYLTLPDSAVAERWLERAQRAGASAPPITWLHRLEVINAFEQHVFVSRVHGSLKITSEQAAAAQAHFRDDVAQSHFIDVTQIAPDELMEQFEDLSLRHTARHGFRTYDLIHVASALLLGCDTFWSFDKKACRLAVLEGLKLAKR
ncbi:MAG: type II toxin-antitoxin system VapC family toxin [Verrucomicrobiota bacterium]|nr:type II toxin-antitoxin system VapC family toxin [Verrucomicrobiota bacterium]